MCYYQLTNGELNVYKISSNIFHLVSRFERNIHQVLVSTLSEIFSFFFFFDNFSFQNFAHLTIAQS
jgi:hypothetical protein